MDVIANTGFVEIDLSGAKATVAGGRVDEIFTATRPVLPGKPCMDCYGLIPTGRLDEDIFI
jgi:hypothetical protein